MNLASNDVCREFSILLLKELHRLQNYKNHIFIQIPRPSVFASQLLPQDRLGPINWQPSSDIELFRVLHDQANSIITSPGKFVLRSNELCFRSQFSEVLCKFIAIRVIKMVYSSRLVSTAYPASALRKINRKNIRFLHLSFVDSRLISVRYWPTSPRASSSAKEKIKTRAGRLRSRITGFTADERRMQPKHILRRFVDLWPNLTSMASRS